MYMLTTIYRTNVIWLKQTVLRHDQRCIFLRRRLKKLREGRIGYLSLRLRNTRDKLSVAKATFRSFLASNVKNAGDWRKQEAS